jgi:O-antigen/teichoic acid export membrane protein
MLKALLGVISVRYVIALTNLALVFINARLLGIEGLGVIGIVWATININATVNSLFSSNSLVYFVHRYPVRQMYLIACVWIVVGSTVGCSVLSVLGVLPEKYVSHILGLTIIYSLVLCQSRLLLGKDDLRGFNVANLLQAGSLFFIMLFFYYILEIRTVEAYILGMFAANAMALLYSMGRLLPFLREKADRQEYSVMVKNMFGFGLWGSADNLAETLATRLNYFLVEHSFGLSGVGLLDSGTKIAESVWNISRGAASIEYNRVAGLGDNTAEQKRITRRILAFSTATVAAVIFVICLLPETLYTDYLFGSKFVGIRTIIICMSPGIVCYAANNILSHYFLGRGNAKYSALTSFAGLATLLVAGSFLIPSFGVTGSALSSSIAYLAMAVFAGYCFLKCR